MTEVNYSEAWKTLVERFDKPRMLTNVVVEKILGCPVLNQESTQGLEYFLAVFEENVAILDSLGIQDLSGFLLFVVASKVLPTTTRRLFETNNDQDFPLVSSLVTFIKERLKVLQHSNPIAGRDNDSDNKHRVGSHNVLSATQQEKSTTSRCVICKGNHVITVCPQFLDVSPYRRKQMLISHRICFRCLIGTRAFFWIVYFVHIMVVHTLVITILCYILTIDAIKIRSLSCHVKVAVRISQKIATPLPLSR